MRLLERPLPVVGLEGSLIFWFRAEGLGFSFFLGGGLGPKGLVSGRRI